jgi:hypothetical protein
VFLQLWLDAMGRILLVLLSPSDCCEVVVTEWLNVCLVSGNSLGSVKCVRAQPSPCCFLDAEGLLPLKLLQLAGLW